MNSEVSLESFAEAGEQLCYHDISRELVPHCSAKTGKSCDFDDRPLLALSDVGTRLR